MLIPTKRLALVVAGTSPVWLFSGTRVGQIAAVVVEIAVLLVVAADFARLPSSKRFEIARELPLAGALGEDLAVVYRVTSRWESPAIARITELLPEGLSEEQWRELNLVVPAGEEASATALITPQHRGIFTFGEIGLRLTAPFGLLQRASRRAIPATLTIAPSLRAAGRYRLLTLQHRLRLAGAHPLRRRGAGMAFSNLRDYVIGDDPRLIDWKHTARRGKVISREYTEEQGQALLIAIDAGRMMTELAGERSRFELALSSALALASVAVASGDKVGLVVFDEVIRASLAPAAGPRALQAIRRAVIGVSPRMVEPDYALAFSHLSARQRSRSLIVLFTDVIDARASRALISNNIRGASRHLPLVVALRNDPLFASAELSGPAGASQVYRSAAAEELIQVRMEALQKMRSSGVLVADVSPRAMTPAVINRYLEIKARGIL